MSLQSMRGNTDMTRIASPAITLWCGLLAACTTTHEPIALGEQSVYHINTAQQLLAKGNCMEAALQFERSLAFPTGGSKVSDIFNAQPDAKECYLAYLEKIVAESSTHADAQTAEGKINSAEETGILASDVARELRSKLSRSVEAHKRAREEEIRLSEERQRQEEEIRQSLLSQIMEAEKSAKFSCRDKIQCGKAFSLTQIYIDSVTDMKLQITTETILETYNPNEDGKIGLKALRLPGRGTSATITLSARCRNDAGYHSASCNLKKLDVYTGFRPFLEQSLMD